MDDEFDSGLVQSHIFFEFMRGAPPVPQIGAWLLGDGSDDAWLLGDGSDDAWLLETP